jgi:hypothetical protein
MSKKKESDGKKVRFSKKTVKSKEEAAAPLSGSFSPPMTSKLMKNRTKNVPVERKVKESVTTKSGILSSASCSLL